MEVTLGVIVGNRGFFPDRLCDSGRKEILQSLQKLDIGAVILPEASTKFGTVESLNDAQQCADLFRCSNLPKDIFVGAGDEKPAMDYQAIIAGTVGEKNTYGTIVGRVQASPFTYLRASTDDAAGKIRAYVGEGDVTDDRLQTFGGYGVVRIPQFQKLLAHICENGFEHHVAVNPAHIAKGVQEALCKYLGWEVYYHR